MYKISTPGNVFQQLQKKEYNNSVFRLLIQNTYLYYGTASGRKSFQVVVVEFSK